MICAQCWCLNPAPCCLQEHAADLAADLASSKKEQERLQAEAAAALQDAREALGRETDVQEELQRADQVINRIP